MAFRLQSNSKLRKELGEAGAEFLEYSLGSFVRILPHTETFDWKVSEGDAVSQANFVGNGRRELSITVRLKVGSGSWAVKFKLQRRRLPNGVGAVSRTIDEREKDIANCGAIVITEAFQLAEIKNSSLAAALQATVDERIVARHLQNHHGVSVDLGTWFTEFRRLSEQSYESKSLTFGCVVNSQSAAATEEHVEFPVSYFALKKFRALSDGYRTVYLVSSHGAVISFSELEKKQRSGNRFYPQWCEDMAAYSREGRFGLCLTRQGDLIVLDAGHLTFTYRFGRWQYWNHSHIIDLIKNAARVQHVTPADVSGVVRGIYRAALDVSFRRSGGLFVLLRNQNEIKKVVRLGDAIEDRKRSAIDKEFDKALKKLRIQSAHRGTIADLAALDGAIVLNNRGQLMAYGAILEPKRKGKIQGAEGSRTKAAIGASNYGLAVKVSSDGDITVYLKGKELIRV